MAASKLSEWDFGFEADAAQEKGKLAFYPEFAANPRQQKLIAELNESMSRDFHNRLAAGREERRQRRATPRFSDVFRAGYEAVDNKGRPTLEDLQRENRENDRRRDDRHGRQP